MNDSDLQKRRFLAAGVDVAIAIVIGLAFGIASIVLGFALRTATGSGALGAYVPRVVSFLGALVWVGFYLARDILAGDRSLGKKTQNIRVVTTAGAPITFMESARRNAIFAIGPALTLVSATLELLPCLGGAVNCLLLPVRLLGYLVALGAAIFEVVKIVQDPAGIRVGDQMAGTKVVR